jgi:hypothetical protein
MAIAPRTKVAAVGTAMAATGFCLTAAAVIILLLCHPAAVPRIDGGRVPKSAVKDFEIRLIYS